MIEVEKGPLGPFEEDALAELHPLVEKLRDVPEIGAELLGPAGILPVDRLGVEGRQSGGPEQGVLGGDVVDDLLAQDPQVGQVPGPDAQAGRLVLIGRADAAAGRPDLLVAAPVLGDLLGQGVPGHDEVRAAADRDAVGAGGDPLGLEVARLLEEGGRRDDQPVPDDAERPGVEDARGDEMKDDLPAADPDRVAGVMPALVSGDDVEGRCQQVDDLALAFVSPLGSENEQIGHALSFDGECRGAQKLSPTWTCHWLFLRTVPFSLFQSYSALTKKVELRT